MLKIDSGGSVLAGLVTKWEADRLKNDGAASVNAYAEVSDLQTVFSVKRFEIPTYQREYSWLATHIEDLFSDLCGTFFRRDAFSEGAATGEQSEYFLGVIVTQVRDGGDADKIVDGQQRVTTLMLLFCALLPYLHKLERQRVLDLIYRQDDDCFVLDVQHYNYYLRRFVKGAKGAPPVMTGAAPSKTAAIKRLESAYVRLSELVQDMFDLPPHEELSTSIEANLSEVNNFTSWLFEKTYVVHVQDTDPFDEQRLFDRINTRGMPLSEGARFMSKVLAESNERYPNRASRDWKRARNAGLENLSHLASKRRIRDPLEAEQRLLKGWLIGQFLSEHSEPETRVAVAREMNADPYDWILKAAEDEIICRGTENLYSLLKKRFFPFVYWSKAAYGASNSHDKEFAGLRHARIARIEMLDAAIAGCYFINYPDRTREALSAMADFLDLVAFYRAWRRDWRSPSETRDLVLDAVHAVRTNKGADLRAKLTLLLIDVPTIEIVHSPSLFGGNKTWIRYFLGRLCAHVEFTVMGKQPKPWLFNGKRNDAPQIEHIMSKNYHDFREAFGNDRERMDSERQRLGALTLLSKAQNLRALNRDFSERLPIYLKGPALTAALSPKSYDNHLRLRRRKEGAPSYPFKPYEGITPELIDQRETLYVAIARDIWNLHNLTG